MLDQTAAWSKYTPLSERELVAAAIEFANSGSAASVLALMSGMDIPVLAKMFRVHAALLRESDAEEAWSRERANLNYGLKLIARGSPNFTDLYLPSPAADRMILRPTTTVQGGKITTKYHYVAESLHAVVAHVLTLLADTSHEYGRDLCQCRLPTCGAFFLAVPNPKGTGAPRRLYCTPEHAEEAQKILVAKRVQKHRKNRAANKAAAAKQPRRHK